LTSHEKRYEFLHFLYVTENGVGLGRRLYLNNAFLNYVINDVISRLHCNSTALEIKVPGQVDGNPQTASLFDVSPKGVPGTEQ